MFRYNIKVITISGYIWVYHATLNCRVRGRKYEDHSPELYFSVTIRNMTASTADHHRYDAQKVGCICTSRLVHVTSCKTYGSWRTRRHPGRGCLSGIHQDSKATALVLAHVHFPGHSLLPGSGEKFSSFSLLNLEQDFLNGTSVKILFTMTS